MNFYVVLLELCGAVVLLLFAVRMVRTGVERSQRPALERLLARSGGNPVRSAAIGLVVAALLQSATAVALLAAGFAASGTLSLSTGLALMLGADLGSAIVARTLSVPIDWLVPALIVLGGGLFFRGPSRRWRQAGRILMGVALILVSLRMLGEATAPLRELPMLPRIVEYLQSDVVTAFLLGAAFTWLVHSSVAVILLFAAFAAQGLVPIEVGAYFVLGANLGGGLIAFGLTRAGTVEARRIALGNLLFRGVGAMTALALLKLTQAPLGWLGPDPAQQMIHLHLLFNLLLLVTCLPLTTPLAKLLERMVRPAVDPVSPLAPVASCLDVSVVDQPRLALASAKRELMRMAEIIERMLTPVMELYETGDPSKIAEVRRLEEAVDRAQSEIKMYLARIAYADDMMQEARRGRDLAGFAINLEYVGDAITKTLLKLAETRRDQGLKFSPAGWRELKELHDRSLANMHLAFNVLMSEDREAARQLLAQQEAMNRAGNASAASHLERLRTGSQQSIATSNLHLETVRALNTVATLFASIAYQVLDRSGELIERGLPEQHEGGRA